MYNSYSDWTYPEVITRITSPEYHLNSLVLHTQKTQNIISINPKNILIAQFNSYFKYAHTYFNSDNTNWPSLFENESLYSLVYCQSYHFVSVRCINIHINVSKMLSTGCSIFKLRKPEVKLFVKVVRGCGTIWSRGLWRHQEKNV